jgi:hypothetical protein
VAARLALASAGALAGASPELVHRLGGGQGAASEGTSLLALAPPGAMLANLLNALHALPAYLDGDPRARLPEGVTFAGRIAEELEPYTSAELATGPLGTTLDALAAVTAGVLLLAALRTAVRAWRARDAPLLALCLTPVVQLALITLSAQAAGGYFHARRYWFGALLVLPLLAGNVVALAERMRPPAAAWAARALVGIVLAASLVAQARQLVLPDELASYRALAGDLVAHGERAVFMPNWNAWVVAALSGGSLDPASVHYNHGPILERIAAGPHIAFAAPVEERLPPAVRVVDARFQAAEGAPRRVGPWHWRRYARVPSPVGEGSAAGDR